MSMPSFMLWLWLLLPMLLIILAFLVPLMFMLQRLPRLWLLMCLYGAPCAEGSVPLSSSREIYGA